MTDLVPNRPTSGRSRSIAYTVAALSLAGWVWLLLAVAAGGRAADMGPGMAAIAPLLDRIAFWFPALAVGEHGALMPAMTAWGTADLVLVFAMWAAMVLGMMLPTALPTFRVYARAGGAAGYPVMAGYTAVWLAVAVFATLGQAGLTAVGAMVPHMAPVGIAFSASVLVAAGLYQFTPLKMACLVRCRNPHAIAESGLSPTAAVRVGVEEGLACLGCCWALMAVMFAAGLMNLAAMAVLGALMGIEKLANGVWLTYSIGVVLLFGGLVLASGLFFG